MIMFRQAIAGFVTALAALTPWLQAAEPAQENPWYRQGEFAPEQRVELQVRNPLDVARSNLPVILTRAQLSVLPDVHELAITLVDPALPGRPEPSDELYARQGGHETRAETNGGWIHYQLDDLDQDGLWDELAFQLDLEPDETKTLYLYIGFQYHGWAPHRTHAGIGSYVRHTVPFWEGENIGWKLWYPTDVDVYGKRRPLLMSYRLYMDNIDGYGASQVNPDFGSDIMQVGSSFGGGGIGVFEDSLQPAVVSRPRFTPRAPATRFNAGPQGDTRYAFTLLGNGPVRSLVRVRTFNWDSGHGRYELEQVYSAWAGESYSTCRVRFTRFEPANPATAFAVGIRQHVGETAFFQRGGVIISGAPEAIRNPDDQGLRENSLMVDYVGTALVVRDDYRPEYVHVPAYEGNHAFRIQPDEAREFAYLIAAGWSEGAVNRTPAEFQDYVLRVARDYNAPAELASARLESLDISSP